MATPVFCTYCGQKFSRNEHLERHVITHTNVKPYKCELCHSSFNRQDLFKRHVRVIHREGAETDPRQMVRTPIACVSCAKAKARCDREMPCCRCTRKGIECQPRMSTRVRDQSHSRIRARSERAATRSPQTSKSWLLQSSFDSAPPSLASSVSAEPEFMSSPPLDAMELNPFTPNDFAAYTSYLLAQTDVTSTTQSEHLPIQHMVPSASQGSMITDAPSDAIFIPWAENVAATPEPGDYDYAAAGAVEYPDGYMSFAQGFNMPGHVTPPQGEFRLYGPSQQMGVPMDGGWSYSFQ